VGQRPAQLRQHGGQPRVDAAGGQPVAAKDVCHRLHQAGPRVVARPRPLPPLPQAPPLLPRLPLAPLAPLAPLPKDLEVDSVCRGAHHLAVAQGSSAQLSSARLRSAAGLSSGLLGSARLWVWTLTPLQVPRCYPRASCTKAGAAAELQERRAALRSAPCPRCPPLQSATRTCSVILPSSLQMSTTSPAAAMGCSTWHSCSAQLSIRPA
jgi:hypothetical protein